MNRFSLVACAACFLTVAGCAGDAPSSPLRRPIINGSLDTTHQAVVAVVGTNLLCSGTIVAKNASYLYVLTAASCVAPHAAADPTEVVQGNDYLGTTATTYPVEDCLAHPSFNGQAYNFAMCRCLGAGASTPVIPAATSPDGLATSAQIRAVGYGITETNPTNSQRRYFLGTITSLDGQLIWNDQTNGGPCLGDTGGPLLSVTGTERVVGVSSFGDLNCNQYGASGRVAPVSAAFITAYIDNTPIGPLTCEQCTVAATSGAGACVAAVTACAGDASCQALTTCLDGCSTPTCEQQCMSDHPAGVTLWDAIQDCVCETGCQTECASAAACQPAVPPSDGGSADGGSADGGSADAGTGDGGTDDGGAVASDGAVAPEDAGVVPGADAAVADAPPGATDAATTGGQGGGGCALSRRAPAPGAPLLLAGVGLLAVACRRRRRDGTPRRPGAEDA
jgi:hypothetical protein